MAKNKDGNEIGARIEADDLLTQIAKQRIAKKVVASKPKKKPAKVVSED
jgi:hypothetical protein